MALKATIFKARLQVNDLERHYYCEHSLTLARHPSETDERLMLRLLAFALHADERLAFTRGLSSTDEPDLWQKSDSGDIELWIELGQPDSKRLRQACGLAERVVVYNYGGRAAEIWWRDNAGNLSSLSRLSVYHLHRAQTEALAAMAQRTMELSVTIDGGVAWITDGEHSLELAPERRLPLPA